MINVLHKAIKIYGVNSQVDMMIEEMSELTKALLKERRYVKREKDLNYTLIDNILEEAADVDIMLRQIKIIYDYDNKFDKIKESKIRRLRNILNEK